MKQLQWGTVEKDEHINNKRKKNTKNGERVLDDSANC